MEKNNMGEYSEFELQMLNMKIGDAETYQECGAVGTAEEELASKTITKKYRGVVVKQRTKGTGAGTLKLSIHMNYEMYCQTFGMVDEELKEGVKAYGMNSKHPTFGLTALILDEDDDQKLKAYPSCTIISSMSRKIDNGTEEVAESELEIAIMPDKYGYGMYEVLAEKASEDVKSEWMSNFNPELVRIIKA